MTEADKNRVLRVVAVGPLPPPPGGVASSLQSLVDATQPRDDISVTVIPWKQMWKLPALRPDILHLHFSSALKRGLGALWGRLCGAGVIHTIHGNGFDFSKPGNRLACALSQGFILLNPEILGRFAARGVTRLAHMTPIFQASETREPAALPEALEQFLQASQRERTALVYANNRQTVDGRDIYGFDFIASVLPDLKRAGVRVIFLDPNGHYTTDEILHNGAHSAFLHQSHVDFRTLLRRVDLYLRPTSTDGNSVAVLEALELGVPVLASDAVPRTEGVITFAYGKAPQFIQALQRISSVTQTSPVVNLTPVEDYIAYLKEVLT